MTVLPFSRAPLPPERSVKNAFALVPDKGGGAGVGRPLLQSLPPLALAVISCERRRDGEMGGGEEGERRSCQRCQGDLVDHY